VLGVRLPSLRFSTSLKPKNRTALITRTSRIFVTSRSQHKMAFTSIAKDILRDAELLDEYVRANNLPPPSFDADGPGRTVYNNKEATTAHASLLANTHRLHLLAEGPAARWMGTLVGGPGDAMTAAAVYHFKIVDHVPLNSQASFEDVAAKCGLALRDFKMIVRYAMTNFIFCEPPAWIHRALCLFETAGGK